MPCGTLAELPSTKPFEQLATLLQQSGSVRPVIQGLNSDGSMNGKEIDQLVETLDALNDIKAVTAVIRSFPDFRVDRAKLTANTVPCLCVIGEHDPNRFSLASTVEHMASLEMNVIEGVNHMTAFRHPAFVAAIKSFIREHKSRDGAGE